MATYSVHTLPKLDPDEPAFRECSRKLTALRLKSLQSDPDSWISVYEGEVNQPPQFWWNRLKDPRAVHHVVVINQGSELISTDVVSQLLESEWVGFVVVLMPMPAEAPEYCMNALYIDSNVRGHGLGKRLVQKVVDTVKQHESKPQEEPPFCLATVRRGNNSALELYKKFGFRIVDADHISEKEGRRYHTTELRFDL